MVDSKIIKSPFFRTLDISLAALKTYDKSAFYVSVETFNDLEKDF